MGFDADLGVDVVGVNGQKGGWRSCPPSLAFPQPSRTREGFSAALNFSLTAPELQNGDPGQRRRDPGAQGESRLLGG